MSMFQRRLRLSGMEFAACETCNVGTRAADAVAGLMAHISAYSFAGDWRVAELPKLLSTVDQLAPGVRAEIVNSSNARRTWRLGPRGLYQEAIEARADGPILKRHMTVFTAKMGMALYREHVGLALPLDGGVFTAWFLNAGLSQDAAEAMLSILPVGGALKQGRQHSIEQFAYRYNCDNKSILAALAGFHSNLHLLVIATSEPATYAPAISSRFADFVPVGSLVERLAVEA